MKTCPTCRGEGKIADNATAADENTRAVLEFLSNTVDLFFRDNTLTTIVCIVIVIALSHCADQHWKVLP